MFSHTALKQLSKLLIAAPDVFLQQCEKQFLLSRTSVKLCLRDVGRGSLLKCEAMKWNLLGVQELF